MKTYDKNDLCIGCGEHFATYHALECEYDPDLFGECDTCGEGYELSDRTTRCGECGNCSEHCHHERKTYERVI